MTRHQTARALGLSRSRLFSLALENYLRQRRQEKLLEQLNQAYSDEPGAAEAPNLRTKFHSIQDRQKSTKAKSTGSTSANHHNATPA